MSLIYTLVRRLSRRTNGETRRVRILPSSSDILTIFILEMQDISPVERCITIAIKSPDKASTWHGLVRAGIVDRLCECVSGSRQTLDSYTYAVLPTSPHELRKVSGKYLESSTIF